MTRVVVVGAGFAGLAAADALRRAGAEVVVLEARDRVGGRVWSTTLANGAAIELGAEFVLPGHDVVRETCARLGLELADKGMLYGDREPRGVRGRRGAAAPRRRGGSGGAGVACRPRRRGRRGELPRRARPSSRRPARRSARARRSRVQRPPIASPRRRSRISPRSRRTPARPCCGGNQRIALKLAEGSAPRCRSARPSTARRLG